MMELVLIHGWGLDASLWNDAGRLLPQYKKHKMDLGFFGNAHEPELAGDKLILVGHSLGFVHGMTRRKDWAGWISINSFPRFVRTETRAGCTSAAELRDIRKRLSADAEKTLKDFHYYIGAEAPPGSPNAERLREGLDELSTAAIEETLFALDAPGLVLASKNDILVPSETSEKLAALAPRAGIAWHDSGGHVLPQSDPKWCAREIQNYMETNFA